jgi:fused signal recognition particle receptor
VTALEDAFQGKKEIDADLLDELEYTLVSADIGVRTTTEILDTIRDRVERHQLSDVAQLKNLIRERLLEILQASERAMPVVIEPPAVIMVVGVNGAGKTTTIGKLAAKLTAGGLKVTLAAGDTFRAAAIEQLKIWGERTGSTVVSSKLGADAAGLAFDAYEKAKEAGSDVLIIDTAGRLQNKVELMAELEKIVRVLGKHDPDAPHTVLQTVDATTGQNAMSQVETFRNVAGVSGLVMTKLDGTARGGILGDRGQA